VPILSGIIIGQKQTPSNLKAVLMSLAFVLSMSIAYGLIGATAGFFGGWHKPPSNNANSMGFNCI